MQGEGYAVSSDSFDPSKPSSLSADSDRDQRQLNDYVESMPSRPADYMFDKDISSDSRNGFETFVGTEAKTKNKMCSPLHHQTIIV